MAEISSWNSDAGAVIVEQSWWNSYGRTVMVEPSCWKSTGNNGTLTLQQYW